MIVNFLLGTIAKVCLSISCLLAPVDSPATASTHIVIAAAPSDATPINSICPVTSDEEVDPRFTVVVDGQVIGLCCKKCVTRFKADPDQYLPNLRVMLTQVNAEFGEDPPPLEHMHEHATDEENQPHPDADTSHEDADTGAEPHEAHDHDHTKDHSDGGRSPFIAWLGKLHPPSTHLPIGLLFGAVLAEIGFLVRKERWLRQAAGFCLFIAMLGALGAMTLGWFNAGFVLFDDDWVQATHRWLGTSTAVLSVIAFILYVRTRGCLIKRRELAYRTMLLLCVTLVGATGFLGGALIYGLDHYSF